MVFSRGEGFEGGALLAAGVGAGRDALEGVCSWGVVTASAMIGKSGS